MQFLGAKDEILYLSNPEKILRVDISNRTFIYLKNYFVETISEGPVSLYLRIHVTRTVKKVGAYGGESSVSSIGSYSAYYGNDGTITRLSPNEKVRISI